jgi:multisubunit Na+/H+ antiporter MnhC subunit
MRGSMSSPQRATPPRRQYPGIYEKAAPIAIALIVLAIVVLVVMTAVVLLRN